MVAYDRLADLEDKCDSIDAMVFTGDLLYITKERKTLKSWIERWSAAIKDHEQSQAQNDFNDFAYDGPDED